MVKKEFEVYSYEEAVAAIEAEGYKVIRNKPHLGRTLVLQSVMLA